MVKKLSPRRAIGALARTLVTGLDAESSRLKQKNDVLPDRYSKLKHRCSTLKEWHRRLRAETENDHRFVLEAMAWKQGHAAEAAPVNVEKARLPTPDGRASLRALKVQAGGPVCFLPEIWHEKWGRLRVLVEQGKVAERELLQKILAVAAGGVMLDVGVGIVLTAIPPASFRAFQAMHAFEPEATSYLYLTAGIQSNALTARTRA